jgi:hypothetical protein
MVIFQFLFISILGTILHFAYDLSNHIFIFSIIGAVNESPWEHLKMGIFPWFFWYFLKIFILKSEISFLVSFLSISYFMIGILTVYYSYIHFTKKAILPIDITNFYHGILGGVLIDLYLSKKQWDSKWETFGLIGFLLILFMALINTYYPFKCHVFLDERMKLYGMEAHEKRCKLEKHKNKNK